MAEKELFNGQVDWLKTFESDTMPMTYVTDFLTSIESGEPLPTIDENVFFIYRKPSAQSGVDIEHEVSLC